MPGRGSTTFKRSMFWMGASLTAVLVGLVMITHEQHAHDVCAASIHGLSRNLTQAPPSCGFADTVYWAGMVIFVAGAVSLIGAMWSAATTLSGAIHIRGKVVPRTRIWSSSPKPHTAESPPAFQQHPTPAWLSKLAAPVPFEVPARRRYSNPTPAYRSALSATNTADIRPTPSPEYFVAVPGAVRVVASRGTVQFIPVQTEEQFVFTPSNAELVLTPSARDTAFTPTAEQAPPYSSPVVPAPVESAPVASAPPVPAPLPAPAWYPDPERPDAIRWWDGSRWGESRLRQA
jgi:hypothetical protein